MPFLCSLLCRVVVGNGRFRIQKLFMVRIILIRSHMDSVLRRVLVRRSFKSFSAGVNYFFVGYNSVQGGLHD